MADDLVEEMKRDADKGELLLWASARGLGADVAEIIATGGDPCAKDKHGRQAVHYAASNGHVAILEFLATKGVDMDADDSVGRGALHYAAAGGHPEAVSLLLSKGCWRDAPDGADDTPLHLAARAGSTQVVQQLLAAGAKAHLPNKRSLTPFAEAVLAGRTHVADLLGRRHPLPPAAANTGTNNSNSQDDEGQLQQQQQQQHYQQQQREEGKAAAGEQAADGDGGLAALKAALAVPYRGMPLLHLAAGLGQARVVEWLLQHGCDACAPAGERQLTPLHAAALSGDPDTIAVLLKTGADPLAQTSDGQLPLELVPRAAPPKAPAPVVTAAAAAAAAAADGADAAPNTATADPLLLRAARRSFKTLARAAAEKGGVDEAAAELLARSRESSKSGRMDGGDSGRRREQGQRRGKGQREEEQDEGDPEVDDHPVVVFVRQFSAMGLEQQVAKVESYARMEDRQLRELPYIDDEALAAVGALRQAAAMVEMMGAVAALRADEEFQSDINDPRVAAAISDVKKSNNLERYEDQPAVMSVAAKFKRLHAVSRKAGGLQVTIDDLRADGAGNDPASTAARIEEMKAAQRAAAMRAVKAVLKSAGAAVPEHIQRKMEARKARAARGLSDAAAGGGDADGGSGQRSDGGEEGEEAGTDTDAVEGQQQEQEQAEDETDEKTKQLRQANRARVDKLRAAATSAWSKPTPGSADDVGYVDRFERSFESQGTGKAKAKAKAKGPLDDDEDEPGSERKRKSFWSALAPEIADSLVHTLKALLFTGLGFLLLWVFGMLPHQQTRALLARQEAARAAAAAVERVLEGLTEGETVTEAVAAGAAAAVAVDGTCGSGGEGGDGVHEMCGVQG